MPPLIPPRCLMQKVIPMLTKAHNNPEITALMMKFMLDIDKGISNLINQKVFKVKRSNMMEM